MGNRTYSPEFKLQVVLEALQSDGTDRGAHTLQSCSGLRHPSSDPLELEEEAQGERHWRSEISKAFGGGDELKEKNDKIAKLERMVGKKEVEIALLKNFLGEKGDPRSP